MKTEEEKVLKKIYDNPEIDYTDKLVVAIQKDKTIKIKHATINKKVTNHDKHVVKALENLIGAKIVDAGFIDIQHEGGLTIDFIKNNIAMRLVIGYNDLGEWIEYYGETQNNEKEKRKINQSSNKSPV